MINTCPICGSDNSKIVFNNYPGYVKVKSYNIYNCKRCDTNYIKTNPQEIEMIYDAVYKNEKVIGYDRYLDYAKAIANSFEPLKKLADLESTYYPLHKLLNSKPKSKILEIGCGYGYLTYALIKSGHDVHGIDLSSEAIHFAKKNFGDYYTQISYEDFSELNIDQKYDFIIATELIEHLINPTKLISHAAKILENEGSIIITTPNKDYYPKDHVWFTDLPPVHTCWLGRKSIKSLAARFELSADFFNFKYYFSKYENRLIRFIRSRNEPIQNSILNEDFSINSEKLIELSSFHKFVNKLLHKFAPIRIASNIIYSLINGEEKVLAAILTKK